MQPPTRRGAAVWRLGVRIGSGTRQLRCASPGGRSPSDPLGPQHGRTPSLQPAEPWGTRLRRAAPLLRPSPPSQPRKQATAWQRQVLRADSMHRRWQRHPLAPSAALNGGWAGGGGGRPGVRPCRQVTPVQLPLLVRQRRGTARRPDRERHGGGGRCRGNATQARRAAREYTRGPLRCRETRPPPPSAPHYRRDRASDGAIRPRVRTVKLAGARFFAGLPGSHRPYKLTWPT
jgi:hypothetical protein